MAVPEKEKPIPKPKQEAKKPESNSTNEAPPDYNSATSNAIDLINALETEKDLADYYSANKATLEKMEPVDRQMIIDAYNSRIDQVRGGKIESTYKNSDEFIARLVEFDNVQALASWKAKHDPEITALPQEQASAVRKAYAEKFNALKKAQSELFNQDQ
jgi:hypothetical protein